MQSALPLVWSEDYTVDFAAYGIDKPFALDRGERVVDKLQSDFGGPLAYIEAPEATVEQLQLIHSQEYLQSLTTRHAWIEILELKEHEYFPERAKHELTDMFHVMKKMTGGTIEAVKIALAEGLSANFGGGLHHAYPNEGRGFCALSDIGVGVRLAQKNGLAKKAMVVDLDFHQGDGTAVVFQGDQSVFTLSVHSEEGWPEEKQQSTLDVGVLSCEQHLYLEKVADALEKSIKSFAPDLLVYVAGSDPYELDFLPGSSFIKLPLATMRQRDEMVIDFFHKRGIPLAMLFAGGYGPHVWEVHYWAVRHLLLKAGKLAASVGV